MIDDFNSPKQPQASKAASEPPVTAAKQAAPPALSDETPLDTPQANEFRVKTAVKQNKKFIVALVGAIVVVLGVVGFWYNTKNSDNQAATNSTEQQTEMSEAKVEKYYSPLSGVEVADATVLARPVTGLMIENSLEARPQSGLDGAGVVFEAIAEGGITRFFALYQDKQPDYLGPVRSARPYYVEWAKMYDATFGHVGGSPAGLALIKSLGVKDLDQFSNGAAFERISQRSAPHNVYTSFTKLDAANAKKGYTKSTFTPWLRKIDVPQTPTASTIDFDVSGPLYSPRFTYDAATNSYKRSQNGAPHLVVAKDRTTKTQLNPKVVVAIIAKTGLAENGKHSTYATTGSGKVYVFQDGIVSIGTWSRSANNNYVFTDTNGLPLKLNAGQTWVTVLGGANEVSYKP